MTRTVSIIMVVVIFFSILAVFGCEEAPPATYTFQSLIANKASFEKLRSPAEYTDGLIVYVTDNSDKNFFVVTYPNVSKEMVDKNFIIVRAQTKGLTVGDVVAVKGVVTFVTGKSKNGEEVIVHYLSSRDLRKTSRVDIEDPNYEELIAIVRQEIQQQEEVLMYILWLGVISIMMTPNYP